MRNLNLYGWIFKYNPYEDVWNATRDDNYFSLANGHNHKVLSTKGIGNIGTLLDIINKTDGDRKKIKKLVK